MTAARRFLLGAAALALALPRLAAAQGGDAAFVFGYQPKDGTESGFEEGYRRHLAWHAEAGDPLVWYGWTVAAGDRIGAFVDGTFGVTFEALDRRVDPAGDRTDFAVNVAPFVHPRFRQGWILRPELGTDRSLEERRPSPLLHVVHVVLRPGAGAAFETRLHAARERLTAAADPPDYAWYQVVVGGEEPGWTLIVPRAGFSDYDRHPVDLEAWFAAPGDPPLADLVAEARSEIWAYRPDLSHLPE